MTSDKNAFVADLERQHGQRLRRVLTQRMRGGGVDVADLVQEVYLRLLRIDHHESIRSSEAYLFTTAFHVLHQHIMRRAALPESVEITTMFEEIESGSDTDPLRRAETQERMSQLQAALQELSPKARAVLLLHRRDGYSLDEIARQLGFSRANAAKYLAKALAHCRNCMQERA